MTRRLIQWEPIQVRVDAAALQSLLGDQIKLTFANGLLQATTEISGAPAGATVALQTANGGVTITITLLPPPFLDLAVTRAEIVPDGIDLLIDKGGLDRPVKSSS